MVLNKKVNLSVCVDRNIYDKITEIADKLNLTKSIVTNLLLRNYLNEHRKEYDFNENTEYFNER